MLTSPFTDEKTEASCLLSNSGLKLSSGPLLGSSHTAHEAVPAHRGTARMWGGGVCLIGRKQENIPERTQHRARANPSRCLAYLG